MKQPQIAGPATLCSVSAGLDLAQDLELTVQLGSFVIGIGLRAPRFRSPQSQGLTNGSPELICAFLWVGGCMAGGLVLGSKP